MPENFAKTRPQSNSCPKFSIIIPAYNTEKYIAKCLDSLINQDIPERNYEILITDDGSADMTGKICDDYAAKYPFILVTHTDNHGPSHARNIALDKCRGEYVMFCDADDFVSPQLVSVVTKAADVFGKPDMMIYGLFTELPAGGWPACDVEAMSEEDGRLCSAEEVCFRIFTDPMTRGFSWNKAVKRELALSVRYDESLTFCEDEYYLLSMLLSNKEANIYYIDYCLYCYVQHKSGRVTNKLSTIRTKEGYPTYIEASEKMLAIPDLPERIRTQLEGRNYAWAVRCIFLNRMPITPAAYDRLKAHIRRAAWKYYLRYSGVPLMHKIQTFMAHILILLHIHKPRRK